MFGLWESDVELGVTPCYNAILCLTVHPDRMKYFATRIMTAVKYLCHGFASANWICKALLHTNAESSLGSVVDRIRVSPWQKDW
mmetsp:Transcript_11758/g.32165  ORF Transcript_11758/g.32165 Transcript_11758/m.32165 type:complete len:84 (-) Transcript_11758:846-1097(-)